MIGAYDAERLHEQEIGLDVEIERDVAAAAASDRVMDTTDYDRIVEILTQLCKARRFRLLEALAAEAAAEVLRTLPEVRRVSLTVRKPGAVAAASSAWVRLERIRPV